MRFTFNTAYKNPTSAKSITSVTFKLIRSGSTLVTATQTSIITFQASKMTTATLSPVSNTVGATGSGLTVSFTPTNDVSSTTIITVTFPDYVVGVGEEYIDASNPTCSGVTNMKTSLTCTYSSSTNTLSVSSPVSSTVSGGTSMSFKVIEFKNPYNGKSRSGFSVSTFDSSGNAMDSINSLSLQVSNFA